MLGGELHGLDGIHPKGVHDLGAVEEASPLLGRPQAVLDEVIGEDLLQRATAGMLAEDVLSDAFLG